MLFILYFILISFSFPVYSNSCYETLSKDKTNSNSKKLWPAFSTNITGALLTLNPAKIFINNDRTKAKNQFREAFNKMKYNEDNRYISFQYDLFGRELFAKVISINQDGMFVEFIGNDGIVKRLQLSRKELRSAKVSMDSKNLFIRMENAPEEIKSFNIPKTNEEDFLKQQYYKPIFYEGLDEMNWMINMAKALRNSKADPYKTHIEDFALKISDTIELIKKNIVSSGERITEKMTILSNMAQEAQDKVNAKRVTYYWWIHWHQRLSMVEEFSNFDTLPDFFTDSLAHSVNWWRTEKDLQKTLNFPYTINKLFKRNSIITSIYNTSYLIQRFPLKIIFPSMQPLGLLAFNRANGENIIPVNLSHKTEIMDNISRDSRMLFAHDISHAMDGFGNLNRLRFGSNQITLYFKKQFHDLLMEKEKSLSKEEREKIALAYFLLTHEFSYDNNSATTPVLMKKRDIYRALSNSLYVMTVIHDPQPIFPHYINLHTEHVVKGYLKEISETFALTAQQIVREIEQIKAH